MKQMHLSAIVAYGVSCIFWSDLPAVTSIIPFHEVKSLHVAEGTNFLEDVVLLDGTLRKTGPGMLVVPTSRIVGLNGEIVVAEGRLLFVDDSAGGAAAIPEPTDILQKAAFWVEADRNVATGTDGVVRWYDARENSQPLPARIYAESQTSFTEYLPSLSERSDGTPYLDFGGLGSGRWMLWKNPVTSSNVYLNIRSAIVAQGPVSSQGHVLGSATADDEHPSGFLENASGNKLYSYALAPIKMDTWYLAPVKTGRMFRDGLAIDGALTPVLLADQTTRWETGFDTAGAESFFNHLNKHNEGYYVGGDRLYAAAIFTNRISAAEGALVDAYFHRKYVSSAVRLPSKIKILKGATAQVPECLVERVVCEGNVVFDAVAPAVVADESGMSSFAIGYGGGTGAIYNPALKPLVLSPGVRYVSTDDRNVTLAAASGQIAEVDASSAPVTIGGSTAANISVLAGQVKIVSPESGDGVLGPAIECAFESAGFEGYPATELAVDDTVGGWTRIGSEGKVKITSDASLLPMSTPYGTNFLYLVQNASVKTRFYLPQSGRYALSFSCNGRKTANSNYYGDYYINVFADLAHVATVQVFPGKWRRLTYLLPYLEAGEHELTLTGPHSGDHRAALDDFRLVWQDSRRSVPLENPSFECLTRSGNQPATTDVRTWVFYHDSFPGWRTSDAGSSYDYKKIAIHTVVPNTPIYSAAMTEESIVGTPFALHGEFGTRNLLLPVEKSVSTTFIAPASGSYMVAFKAAMVNGETSPGSKTGSNNGNVNKVSVSIGDVAQTVSVNAEQFARYETGPYVLEAGETYTLTFTEVKTANYEGLALDDVEVYPALANGDNGNLIVNSSFSEGDEEGWTTNGWNVASVRPCVLYATSSRTQKVDGNSWGYYFGTQAFDGDERLRLTKQESASQTVTIPETGTYILTFHCVSRVQNGSVKNGPLPLDVTVKQDGVTRTVASAVAVSDTYVGWQKFEYEIDLASGDCTLTFAGKEKNDRTTLLDAVSLRRKRRDATFRPFAPDAAIDVASGASLVLDFVGTNDVAAVRYAGRMAGAAIDEGRRLQVVVSAETDSGFVFGSGVLRYTVRRGLVITYR